MEATPEPDAQYAKAAAERDKHIEAILKSASRRKVVVAGPGTGKTYLFKRVLRNKNNCLTLTFVNALVEDLSLELYGLSDVRTLHSFAAKLVAKLINPKMKIFPRLPAVIQQDAVALTKNNIDFDELFHERDDENQHVKFYQQRRTYYGDFYGYSDLIFEATKYLENNPAQIPAYDQILVDEFQDFNLLEVSFIESLSKKSPVLVTGDDDQALYIFKSADPKHIRMRHSDIALGYEAFNLPFCSRSTRVIIDAVNDIVKAATDREFLKSRIKKPFIYFESREKDAVSAKNPRIAYSQWYPAQVPWAVVQHVDRLAQELRDKFSVLIISPTKTQCLGIAKYLSSKGFKKVECTAKRDQDRPTLLSGLKLLMDSLRCNLGWRILAKHLLNPPQFDALLAKTDEKNAPNLCNLLSDELKNEAMRMVAVLKALRKEAPLDGESIPLLQKMELSPLKMLRETLAEELDLEPQDSAVTHALRNIPIKVSTIESSKGLSAEYVIISFFDDRYFIQSRNQQPTDKEICNFIVALTRARTKVFLISSTGQEPTFLKWIKEERIETTHRLL